MEAMHDRIWKMVSINKRKINKLIIIYMSKLLGWLSHPIEVTTNPKMPHDSLMQNTSSSNIQLLNPYNPQKMYKNIIKRRTINVWSSSCFIIDKTWKQFISHETK